jgi:hypothetical protein
VRGAADPFGEVDLDGKRLAAFTVDLRRRFAGSFLVDIALRHAGICCRTMLANKHGVIVNMASMA